MASLKLKLKLRSPLPFTPISTANRCGLVEARLYRSPRLSHDRRISTANRCGLVEAEARTTGIVIGHGSPQLIAVASLKQRRSRTGERFVERISTANRCGLVEARTQSRQSPYAPPRSPQLIAVASLKPDSPATGQPPLAGSPQLIAVASLKLDRGDHALHQLADLHS